MDKLGTQTTSITIDCTQIRQKIDNFGASGAWSIDVIGKEWSPSQKERIADLLFSTEKGIGLSLWRFNIGAGSMMTDQQTIPDAWRRTECFKSSEDAAYDWSKQEGQQWFLQAAKDRGVEQFLAFVNSPPVWCTKNGKGHAHPGSKLSTNLKHGYEQKFARFLADVWEYFKEEKGISFQYVSPINEPGWSWEGNQEGCRYNNEDLKRVICAVYDEFQSRQFDAEVDAPEAVEIAALLDDETFLRYSSGQQVYNKGNNQLQVGKYKEYLKELLEDDGIKNKIGNKIAYHSYWSDEYKNGENEELLNMRKALKECMERHPDSKLWMSEYCIMRQGKGRDLGMDSALKMARVIHYDLTLAEVSAWHWWLAVSPYDFKDGLLYTDYKSEGKQNILISKMFWTLGHYSRFIRPDARRVQLLGADDPEGLMGSAFIDEKNNELIIVFIHAGMEDISVSLTFKGISLDASVPFIPYVTSHKEDLEQKEPVHAQDIYVIQGRSIVTLKGKYSNFTSLM